MEMTVRPRQLGRADVVARYIAALSDFRNHDIVPIDITAAGIVADLRAKYRLRPADALQIAACIQHGATAFITNDKRLRHVADLEVLVLADLE